MYRSPPFEQYAKLPSIGVRLPLLHLRELLHRLFHQSQQSGMVCCASYLAPHLLPLILVMENYAASSPNRTTPSARQLSSSCILPLLLIFLYSSACFYLSVFCRSLPLQQNARLPLQVNLAIFHHTGALIHPPSHLQDS